jgi:hypothetical protein
MEVMEDTAPPSSRTVGYDVHATRFPPDPCRLQFASWRWALHTGVELYTPAFGSKRRVWAVHAGIGFETSGIVVHADVQLETSASGRTRWCQALNRAPEPYACVVGRTGAEMVGIPEAVRVRFRVCWPST